MQTLPTSLKAIFFDLDDVLVFSETIHTQAWLKVFDHFQIDPKVIDFEDMIGIADSKQAVIFKKLFGLSEEPSQICELKRTHFFQLIANGFSSALGRNDFLVNASKQFVMGVVSSSPQSVIQKVLSIEKISGFFQFIIGHEDCTHHKPHPLPYQKALLIANVQPHEALVIEDSVSGITSARQANIPVVGLLCNQRADKLLNDVAYYKNFKEIQEGLGLS